MLEVKVVVEVVVKGSVEVVVMEFLKVGSVGANHAKTQRINLV